MDLWVRRNRAWAPVMVSLMVAPLAHPTAGDVLLVSPEGSPAAIADTIVQEGWGSAPGQFGREDEAARTGPTDFAVVDGVLYVLDPVNARVQTFGPDGAFRAEIPIGTRTADFLCVDAAGAITVLDAFTRREIRTFAPNGELRLRVNVPDSIGLCSAIWSDGEQIWVEERHSRVHELAFAADARGTRASVVATLPGRPIGRERGAVRARRAGARDVAIDGVDRRTLRFDRTVASIVALESDARGRVFLAVACPCDERGSAWSTEIVLTVIDAEGRIERSIRLPNQYVTDHYRKLCVTRSGEIIQMQTAEEGVRFVRWSWEPNTKREVTR